MRYSVENRQGKMDTVKRLLALMAVIISVSVVVFTIYMVAASDSLAAYVTDVYDASYVARATVRDIDADLLRLQVDAEDFIQDPAPEAAAQLIERAGAVSRMPEALHAATEFEPQQERFRNMAGSIQSSMEQLAAIGLQEGTEPAHAFFHGEVEPLFQDADRLLEGVARMEDAALTRYLTNAAEINGRINATAVVFAVAVIAVAVLVSVRASRSIRETSAGVYQRDMLFSLIADNVDEVFEIYNAHDDELVFVSSNLERIFGVSPEEYLARHDRLESQLLAEELPMLAELYYDDTGRTRHCEFHYDNPVTGKRQTFHSVLYPVQTEKGDPGLHVLLTRDVTEDARMRAELEAALAQAEAANRSKQEFLSRMSHEVRTPINAIIGMEALAMSSLEDPERVGYYLRQINVSARHLLSLVNDILDMSKIESGHLELTEAPINLDGMLSDLVMMITSRTDQKQQTLTVKTPNCPQRRVLGDELRLRQVLLNLLTNANKYTPEGGKIALRAAQHERSDGMVDMTFSVSDNGLGIRPEDRERLFQPFERGEDVLSQPGTGLGLSISRHLVEGMGGHLEVTGNEGGGSTFSFTVPLRVDPEAAEKALPLPSGGRLLVVEDNLLNMEIARALLTQVGYEVCGAANGREAVERFQQEPAGSFAAVVMDIQMPVMDGFEAALRMRADPDRLGSTPILAMTANVFSKEDKGISLFDDFISKPIDPKRMIAQIEEARAALRRITPGSSDGQSDETIPD